MLTLTITRTEYNLRDGSKKQREVFNLTHKSSKVANDILEYLLNSTDLEGGDAVVCKRGSKVVREFIVCESCRKYPVIKQNRCEYCVKTIKKAATQTFDVPAPNKTIEGIISAIKAKAPTSVKKTLNVKSVLPSKPIESYSPDIFFLRNTFH